MSLKNYFKQYSPNPAVRKKTAWHYLYKKAKRHNFVIYKSNLNWLSDPEFLAIRREWGSIPSTSTDRAFFLFSTARAIRNIPGDTADVGIRYGSSSFYSLKGLADPARPHHIFDSFEGLSAPTEEDLNADKKMFWKQGAIAVTEEETRKCLSMFTNCHYYKGWVPDRFSEVADKKFAFVHVDVDLYQPTLDSLKFFYDRVSPGGIIMCDDYGFSSCPGAKKAVEEFFAGKEPVFYIPTGQALVVKR